MSWTVGPLLLGCLVYLVVPNGSVPQVWLYQAICAGSVLVAVLGIRRNRPGRPGAWWLLLGGLCAMAAGEAAWAWAKWVARTEPFPSIADAYYLAGYVLLGLAIHRLVRERQSGRDLAGLIDAAVVAVGVGVVVGAFVIVPIAADSEQTLLGRIAGSAYPLADVLLLGLLARLISTPGAGNPAYRLLVGATTASLFGDAVYNIITLTGDGASTPRWLDATWLLMYTLLAATCQHPAMAQLSEPAPRREETLTGRRLAALAVASSLAPLTLLGQQALGREPSVVLVALGSLVLSGLVLARLAGLLDRVRSQAVQLSALAVQDGLTGVLNRRGWDLELSHACAAARTEGEPLAVALLDLDFFKAFNDQRGHQAGDRLLKEASAAWGRALREQDVLARYGGEEFALLFPGCGTGDAAAALERLRPLTPSGQTFSAGLALWDGVEEPSAAVARADQALYGAKAAGRDRVHVADPQLARPGVPARPVRTDAADHVRVDAAAEPRADAASPAR